MDERGAMILEPFSMLFGRGCLTRPTRNSLELRQQWGGGGGSGERSHAHRRHGSIKIRKGQQDMTPKA